MDYKYLEALRELQKILRVRRYKRKIEKALKNRPSELVDIVNKLKKI